MSLEDKESLAKGKGVFCEEEPEENLRQGTYKVSGVREVEVEKPKGGYRKLGILTVIDRMIQQAIHQVLNRIYDKTFSPTSYGFRETLYSRYRYGEIFR